MIYLEVKNKKKRIIKKRLVNEFKYI